MSQRVSPFHEDIPFGPKQIEMEHVLQIQCASIEVDLYCQRYECLYHMFRWVSVDSKLDIGFINESNCIQKLLKIGL